MTDQPEMNADKFMAKLQESRHSIQEQIDTARERLKQATGHNADAGDEACALQEQDEATALIRRLERALVRNSQAITRLEKDREDFGLCGSCEDEIEIKRLENDPTVEKCHTCQDLDEVKGTRYAHMGI